MLLVAYRHGLRASEVCDLEWSQIDFAAATLHVRRAKNGKPATHPIRGDELRRCAGCTVRHLNRRLSLCQSEAVPSQLIRLTGWSSVLGKKPACPFRYTRTCSVMPVATRWRTPVTIPARCRITSDARISSTQCATQNWRRPGLKISGANRVGPLLAKPIKISLVGIKRDPRLIAPAESIGQ